MRRLLILASAVIGAVVNIPVHGSIEATGRELTLGPPATAAGYTVVDLHPAGFAHSIALGIDAGKVVGTVSGPATGENYHAVMWNTRDGRMTDLHPKGSIPCVAGFFWPQYRCVSVSRSFAAGIAGSQVAGWGFVTIESATEPREYRENRYKLFWSSPAASSVTSLHPPGYYVEGRGEIEPSQVGGGKQVGSVYLPDSHRRATLWSGTPLSAVDLHPPGFSKSDESGALGTDGIQQVGYVRRVGDSLRAALWSGTAASYIDLHPPGANLSRAWGVRGGQQVGAAPPLGALLWRGTADSVVVLGGIAAYATNGMLQVGNDGLGHAVVWRGTASSRIDLHPAGFRFSFALAIDSQGNIAGYGVDSAGGYHALLWKRDGIEKIDPVCEKDGGGLGGDVCLGTYLTSEGALSSDASVLAGAGVHRDGAATDGVTRLLLRVPSDVPVTFSLKVDNTFADASWGVLTTRDGSHSGNPLTVPGEYVGVGTPRMAFAVYRAPVDFPDTGKPNATHTDRLTVVAQSASRAETRTVINLWRPPVLLVHGTWGGPKDWKKLESVLRGNGFAEVHKANYRNCSKADSSNCSADSFDPAGDGASTVLALKRDTRNALSFLRFRGVAATQVDIVGHSLGGLVARARLAQSNYSRRDNFKQGDFHKIITVGTPHTGTPLADWLWAHRNDSFHLGITVAGWFALIGRPIGPAIDQQQTSSAVLRRLGSLESSSHAIIGTAPAASFLEGWLDGVLRAWAYAALGRPLTNIDTLLCGNGNHDIIVERQSQRGGLSYGAFREIPNVVHANFAGGDSSETDSDEVHAQILKLLRASKQSPTFGQFKYEPYQPCPPSTTDFLWTALRPNVQAPSASATLLPSPGTVVRPGDAVTISFTVPSASPVQGALLSVGSLVRAITGSGPFALTYRIPNQAGRIDVYADTFGGASTNYTASSWLSVRPATSPDWVISSPEVVSLEAIGERTQLTITGGYSDGTDVDLTSGTSGTTYSTASGTKTVVSVTADGLIEATGPGEDRVLVASGGATTIVPVFVTIPDDTETAPTITAQPTNQVANAGQDVQFTLAATGVPAPTYQWQVSTAAGTSWTDLTDVGPYRGTRTATLVVAAVKAELGGNRYRCIISNSAGSRISDTVTLTVNVAPAITAQPANQTVTAGQNASFTVVATGIPTPSYQWQVLMVGASSWSNLSNGAPYSGVTTATLTITGVPASLHTAQFRCVVANIVGSATSTAATLTIEGAPTITIQPVDQTVTAGQTAVFLVGANGAPSPTYRWQVSTNGGATWTDLTNTPPYSGVTTANLTVTSAPASLNDTQYRAVASNSIGSATSSAAVLTVNTSSSPHITLDVPANGSTIDQAFTVSGWAIDRGAGAGTGVDAIHVYAFQNPGSSTPGQVLGAATYGLARPDIGSIFGARFETSGFSLAASGLSPGTYQITAFAHSLVSGSFSASASALVTVTGPQPNPAMSLDGPSNNSTVGRTVTIAGWAIDRGAPSGSGVDTVHVWAYPNNGSAGSFLGVATYGLSRPDIGGLFGGRFTNSGFRLTATMDPGTYRIIAFGRSTVTGSFIMAVAASNVTVQLTNSNAQLFVDTPRHDTTATRPFTVSGWAIDQGADSGTGISDVHVWAFPTSGVAATFVGVATYGMSRPDVGSLFGDARFNSSGFTFTVNGSSLAAGTYDLVVFGRSTVTNGFTVARVVRLTVQ